jgi:signal transduction histidine kinase
VDDRPENLLAIETILEGPYLDVIKAASGSEALWKTLERDFALILLDVMMPEMDGFETAELLKKSEKTRYIPIIFLTALGKDESMVFKGYETGAVDYLLKPLNPDILKSKVRVFLELNRQKELIRMQAEALAEKSRLLEELNQSLEERVLRETQTRLQKERLLVQHSKMAAMGEMIGAIAHQWRQPLNALSLIVADIKDAHAFGELHGAYIDNSVASALQQIHYMSGTIDDFKNFFKPSKKKTAFNVISAVKDVLSLFSAQLKSSTIKVDITCDCPDGSFSSSEGLPDKDKDCCTKIEFTGYPNEFKQVVLNLVSNARDAIVKRRSDGLYGAEDFGRLGIGLLLDDDGRIVLKVSDDGGGIPRDVIDRVFEPYFTTKADTGTGIGLYISKEIIESHMGGKLSVENAGGGAVFTIELT